MKELCNDERPREKLLEKGPEALSNAELIAIMLRTGTGKMNAIDLVTSNSVKATVGKGFFIKCLFAMVLGGAFLTLYIGVRFRKIGGVS